MKSHFNFKNPKTPSLILSAFILFTLFITACNKSNYNESGGTAYVMAVNSAQASAPQDFYVDNNKINATALAYTQSTAYVGVNAGLRNAQFRTSGTTTVNASGGISFVPGSYSSVFFTDDNSAVVTQDDRTSPPANKARVRFINLSSAINTSVDFGLSTGNKIINGLSYKTASFYNDVDANTSFSLYASGSTTAMLSIPTTIQAGKIYTVVVSGATTATLTYTVVLQN